MKHTLLIGEDSALFFENNKKPNNVFELNKLSDGEFSDVRVLSNRSDIELKTGFLPKVLPWQSRLVKKSYVLGNSSEETFFNTLPHENSLEKNKYRTQDILMTPDNVTKQILHNFKKKISGIEHIALIVPQLIKCSGYWIFVGENLLGGHSIYCGFGDFVLFVRAVREKIKHEVAETIIFLERYGYKRDTILGKFSVCNASMDDFHNLYNGYSDEFLVSEIMKSGLWIRPMIGFKLWDMRPLFERIIKYFIFALFAVLVFATIALVIKHHEYSEAKMRFEIVEPKIKMITKSADEMINNFAKQLKSEMEEFQILEEEFDKLRHSIRDSLSGEYQPYDNQLIPSLKHRKNIDAPIESKKILVVNNRPVIILKSLQYMFPENMNVTGYSYNLLYENEHEVSEIIIYTDSDDQVISKFIENINARISDISEIKILPVNNFGKGILIKMK